MNPIDAILSEARAHFEAGDLPAAAAVLSGYSQPEALALLSRIRCMQGDHLAAIKLLRQEAAGRDAADCHFRMGICWQHLSQWDASEKALRRAVSLDNRHTDAFILLGIAQYQQDRLPDAMKAFERALVNDPHALLARYHLAQVCMELGNDKRALSQLHVLQGQKPDYAPTRRLQAAIHLRLKDFRQALVELCWLVEAGHADAWCFASMGRSYRAIGEQVQALRAYEFALRLDPTLSEETFCAAELNEELEQFEAALALFRSLRHEEPYARGAQEAIDRLERRLSESGRSARPASELPAFEDFLVPEVSSQGTLPLARDVQPATQPLGLQEVEYAGAKPMLDRIKRNLQELSGGRLDLDDWQERSRALLGRIPFEAHKEKLVDTLSKLPLKRFLGKRRR